MSNYTQESKQKASHDGLMFFVKQVRWSITLVPDVETMDRVLDFFEPGIDAYSVVDSEFRSFGDGWTNLPGITQPLLSQRFIVFPEHKNIRLVSGKDKNQGSIAVDYFNLFTSIGVVWQIEEARSALINGRNPQMFGPEFAVADTLSRSPELLRYFSMRFLKHRQP